MKQQHVIAAAAAFLAFMQAASFSGSHAEDNEDPDAVKIVRIKMTAKELRAEGIAVNARGSKALPNSCADAGNPGLSVSDEILAHFKSRGFSLTSFCLGLSSFVNFDPETGRQLPIAYVVGTSKDDPNRELPLNLPDCFRSGAPFIDCAGNYDFYEGVSYSEAEQADNRQYGQRLEDEYRSFISANDSNGVFYRFVGESHSGKNTERLYEISGSAVEWAVASSDLPRGYGYALHCCEGPDTAPEDVNLKTYRKKRGVSKTWKDER